MKWMTLVFLGSLNQAVAAPELEPFPQIASERGWDVVASHLEEVVNSAKNDKKRDKALEEQQFHKLSMPVTFLPVRIWSFNKQPRPVIAHGATP